MVAEHAAQHVAKGIFGADIQGFLQGSLGLLDPVVLEEQLGLAAPGFRIAWVSGDHLIHLLQGGLVLAVGILLESPVDFDVDGLTAPLEFFPAAARTGGIGIESHAQARLV